MKRPIVIIAIATLLAVTACLYSCKNDAPLTGNEYITTIKILATNQSDLTTDTFEYVNFNEAKSIPPSYVDTVKLKPNVTYSIQLKVLNEANNPVQDLTDSITSLADEHLMIYNVDPTSSVSVKILDKDSKGLPLGLMSNWKTTDSTSGYLRLILRHQPGHKNGTQTPGNTDFEADYPVVVR
jgi:hypothetical protein